MGLLREFETLKGLAAVLAVGLLFSGACATPEPVLSFIDDESNLSFTHPPRWNVGAAEQGGVRYRYLTAPRLEGDKEALSITFIAPAPAASAEEVAKAYLQGATAVAPGNGGSGVREWTFTDASGVPSRLHLVPAGSRFFGAWVRGSAASLSRYGSRVDAVLASLRVEDPLAWPEERFAGLVAKAPAIWTRGSRLSNATHASMQFKSLPIYVEKGTATVHGFITLAKEPLARPGDLDAFSRMLKERASDTVALLDHQPWLELSGVARGPGYMDYMRSGNAMTSTRIRRWISVKGGVGLVFTCEARADVFDRLDPWCRRMAYTVSLE